jgi:D-alanyl-D-alanine carboxypeptidase
MFRTITVIGLLLLGKTCGANPVETVRIPAVVDELAAEALKKPGTAGLSVCVRVDERVVLLKGYGLADVAVQRPVRPDAIFHACSVSKQFLAAAIMRLVERGQVGLNDPITKYIPEFPTPGRTVTLRHLLSHTSGLKGYTEVPAFTAVEDRDLTHEEVLALVKDEPPLSAPGEQFVYCNTGPYLLGMVVERLSGKDYGTFMRDELFRPLGLRHTRYDPHPADGGNWAIPHKVENGKAVHADPIAWANAFAGGGLSSTAGDLAAWMQALAAGRAVSAESYREMTTVQKLNDGTPTGYGLYLYVREHHGHPVVFHTGTGPGCSAWVANYPSDHMMIAVMSNSDAIWAPRLGIAMALAILGIDTTPKDMTLSGAELRRYVGRFRWTPWEDQGSKPGISRFYAEEGSLWIEAGDGRTSRLLYQGDGVFVVEMEPGFTITFADAAGGAPPETCISDDGTHAQSASRIDD